MSAGASQPMKLRDTPAGQNRIAVEHTRLLADQFMQALELLLAIGTFGELDASGEPEVLAGVARLRRAHGLIREARLALRGSPDEQPGKASP